MKLTDAFRKYSVNAPKHAIATLCYIPCVAAMIANCCHVRFLIACTLLGTTKMRQLLVAYALVEFYENSLLVQGL